MVGGVLGGYLVWVALRGAPAPTTGWRVGWPGAAGRRGRRVRVGWLAAGSIGADASGPPTAGPAVGAAAALAAGSPVPRAALGAALALAALAAAPVLVGRDALRLGLGLLLLLRPRCCCGMPSVAPGTASIELELATLTAVAGAGVAAVAISAGPAPDGRSSRCHDTLRRDRRIRAPARGRARHRACADADPR